MRFNADQQGNREQFEPNIISPWTGAAFPPVIRPIASKIMFGD
jgi:hypothetical protein